MGSMEVNDRKKADGIIDIYRTRLKVSPTDELRPDLSTLRFLTERHLNYIPFENIVLHSDVTRSKKIKKDKSNKKHINRSKEQRQEEKDGNEECFPIKLSREALIDKLLISSQGGCCLELNGLFSMLLDEIGYSSVVLVPCFVFAGKERGHRNKKAKFRVTASHFVLLVTIDKRLMEDSFSSSYNKSNSFIVDVGLGEPSIWPLEYVLDKEQISPEGMRSRMLWDRPWIDGDGRNRQCIVLEWFVEGEGWEPRLQWDVNDAPLIVHEKYDSSLIQPRTDTLTLESFRHVIPM